jgi:hypothetical protein
VKTYLDTILLNMTFCIDVLALHIRGQNAAVLVRKRTSTTIFEIFETQAPTESVMSIPGKLVRSFPGPAVEVPNKIAGSAAFIEEIASFLTQMDHKELKGSKAKTMKAGSEVDEVRESADPHYISQLFTGILRGMGTEVEPYRVVKRIADDVLWDNTYKPWRRSPLWLIIRVALQTSLPSTEDYKHFAVFFHAQLLCLCSEEPSSSSDLLSAMRVKMAQRLLKIQDSVPAFVAEAANNAADRAEVVLQSRWAKVQAQLPQISPLVLDPRTDTAQSLLSLRVYLDRVSQGCLIDKKSSSFMPGHQARLSNIWDFTMFDNGALSAAFEADKHVALFDFERSVHANLAQWTGNNLGSESACAVVASCLEQYSTAALSCYAKDVADSSVMVLTIMVLWVALDHLVTDLYPILLDYSPEIPEHLIESLLLPSAQHIVQANMIQSYLRRRHSMAQAAARGSIFSHQTTESSLSIRYFRGSDHLQALKQAIENFAQQEREEKVREMHQRNQEHARLLERTERMDHKYFINRRGRMCHNWNCNKCRREKEAAAMRIEVHEWPLPSNQLHAEAVVFELQGPENLKVWRSLTYGILCDLGGSAQATYNDPLCTLGSYTGLAQWLIRPTGSAQRVTIASPTKSFGRSHYSSKSLPATESAVGVNNGLKFKLFDSKKQTWSAGPFEGANFAKYGTFTLPIGSSYHHLCHALEGTTHTCNDILANQFDCPKELSLHEHYAFGTLRSGPLLQWMNIARGLEENVLTFNREEVYLLHAQAAWQIGPLLHDDQVRSWHSDLMNAQYGQLLVKQSRAVLQRVKANWLEAASVKTLGVYLQTHIVLIVLKQRASHACLSFVGIHKRYYCTLRFVQFPPRGSSSNVEVVRGALGKAGRRRSRLASP